jgi:hypothetical protein
MAEPDGTPRRQVRRRVRAYEDLPERTREFLESLRPDEVERIREVAEMGEEEWQTLKDGAKAYLSLKFVLKVLGWVIGVFSGGVISAVLLAEKLGTALGWMRGVGK